jgi:glycosyltransferase involved in cell wall biosynthesis
MIEAPNDAACHKPRLLVLASTYPRSQDDPEPRFVHELSRRMTMRFDVTVLCPHARGAELAEIMDGVEVLRYRYAPGWMETLVQNGGIIANLRRSPWKWLLVPSFLFCQWWVGRRVLSRRKIALMHAHWLIPQGVVAAILSRMSGVPYAVTSHGGDLFGLRGRISSALKRWVASSASAMTVVSTAMKDEAERAGLAPRELRVISMGVDAKRRFVPCDGTGRSRSELLFVGRLVAKKGVSVLLEALPSVARRCPDVTLTVVGFGPEEVRLRELAAALDLADRVCFRGAMRQDQLPELYQRAALFVAPFIADASGDQEGLPVALMEAIACGCPAVVGDVAGVRDLVGDSAVASLVTCGDVQELADAIVRVLLNPEPACLRAETLARDVRDRIDWDHVADAYATVLARAFQAPVSFPMSAEE